MSWIIACMIGEAVGIAVVSLGYAVGDRFFPEMAAALIVGAGAVEGLSLGAAQAFAGRAFGLRPVRWVFVTTAAAIVGYGLSVSTQGAAGGETVAGESAGLGPVALVGGGAAFGLFMGFMLGGAQALALPAQLSKASWVVRNMIGWAFAMAIIMFSASAPELGWPLWKIAALGAISGAAGGLFVGAATRGGLTAHRA